jgi:kinesin family protein 6/9
MSVHRAQTEEDALNLLFIGDTNRVVSETPKNDASTRSHCIFIINIESRQPGSDVKLISKCHIVDLSGSERVYHTGTAADKN